MKTMILTVLTLTATLAQAQTVPNLRPDPKPELRIARSQTSSARSYQARMGGSDRGGGNIFRGQPLESYIVDPTTLPGYRLMRARLPQETSQESATQILVSALSQKVWYFVPGPLTELSQAKIGSAVQTQQAALQDFESVWIDQNLYRKMSSKDQAQLLMHELLMGTRLLKFQSDSRQCQAMGFTDQCQGFSTRIRGKALDLNVADYNKVRETTARLMRSKTSLTEDQLDFLLGQNGFSFAQKSFRISDLKNHDTTIEKIRDDIQASLLTNLDPQFLYQFKDLLLQHPEVDPHDASLDHELSWNPSGACKVSDLVLGKDGLSGTVQLIPKAGPTQIVHWKLPSSSPTISLMPDWDNLNLYRLTFDQSPSGGAVDSEKSKVGDAVFDVTMEWERGNFVRFSVDEQVVTEVNHSKDQSGSESSSRMSGLNFVCDIHPHKTFSSN